MNAKPIAFFDVDKTLCDCYAGYHTTVELIRRNIIKKRRLLKAILYNTIGRIHLKANVQRMYEIAGADMVGTQVEDILQIGRETFEKRVKPKLYVEGIAEIERARQEGFKIVLISSSPYMLIKAMEEYLKADASFSNGPLLENGILQKTVRLPLCYREGKVTLARQYVAEQNVSLSDCRFYSDSISDIWLLEAVGHPMVVNPDRKLHRHAVEKRWPILKFTETLEKKK